MNNAATSSVGSCVGAAVVGDLVGDTVGPAVGTGVGIGVGAVIGVGPGVGVVVVGEDVVGALVVGGLAVGTGVGIRVGAVIGVGPDVGVAVVWKNAMSSRAASLVKPAPRIPTNSTGSVWPALLLKSTVATFHAFPWFPRLDHTSSLPTLTDSLPICDPYI